MFYFLIRILSLLIIITSTFLFVSNISFMIVGPLTASGFFLNSNVAGMCYGSIIVLLSLRLNKINVLCIMCLFSLLLLSFSRSSILATSLSLLLFFFVQSKGYKKITSPVIITFFAFFVILGFYFSFPDSFETLKRKLLNAGSSGRTQIWAKILFHLHDLKILLFGNGPNTFDNHGLSAHNTFLNETYNYGILYTIYLYFTTILLFCFSIVKKYYILVPIILFCLILSIVESVMFGGPHFIYVLLLVGYSIAFSAKRKNSQVWL